MMKIISTNRGQCMNKLNKKTELTEKTIHLMVTSLCERDCRFCCNKQYSISDIPFVTDGELKNAEVLCLTGGEPFTFTNPCEIARYYKENYFKYHHHLIFHFLNLTINIFSYFSILSFCV